MDLNELRSELSKYFSYGKSTLPRKLFLKYRGDFEEISPPLSEIDEYLARLLKPEDLKRYEIPIEMLAEQTNIIKHIMTKLRDRKTGQIEFNVLMKKFGTYAIPYLSNYLSMKEEEVTTPVPINGEKDLAKYKGKVMDNNVYVIFIPRAAGFLANEISMNLGCEEGYASISRNEETLQPEMRDVKIGDLDGKSVIVVDPMIATGGVMSSLIDYLGKEKKYGNPKQIIVVGVVATPFGLWRVYKAANRNVKFVVGEIDGEHVEDGSIAFGLNSKGYIVPGLGDAGDRGFGEHL